MPFFAQKLRVDLWVFKSVWIKIRVAEAPKEGIVRVARGVHPYPENVLGL
jgi:hypothetical protein